jgi:phosphoribosylformimino-5-aminoimidazole carboxamide ribotide isomerase
MAAGKPGFELLPAIDLRGGRVVRLLRGDFDAETIYADDPAVIAGAFVAEGATWLHVVDLDGARAGEPRQAEAIAGIVAAVGERARVQRAGGLRGGASVAAALAGGAARVVVGTAALADPAFAATLVEVHGPATIAAALDVRAGLAVGGGWLAGAQGRPVEEVLETLGAAGVETFVVTAIARDGTLAGPDLALLERLIRQDRGRLIASGGIGSLDDLRRVRAVGCAGAILGRALYEARFTVVEAIEAVR